MPKTNRSARNTIIVLSIVAVPRYEIAEKQFEVYAATIRIRLF